MVRPKQRQVYDALFSYFSGREGWGPIEAEHYAEGVQDVLREVERDRRKERKAEVEAARVQRMNAQRDRARGIYSRWATNASHEPTWCDEHGCPLDELPPGARMYMVVDHDHRDPELDVPVVKMICYDCAIAKGIPPVIGGQSKYIHEGAK